MNELLDLLQAHFGLHCDRLTPLSGGLIHRVWLADTNEGLRVIKLYEGEDWTPRVISPTLEIQSYAHAAGLPVPRVFQTGSGAWVAPLRKAWAAVHEAAPGRHISMADLTEEHARACGELLGRLHRTLERLPVENPSLFIPDPDQVRERSMALLRDARARKHPDDQDRLAIQAADKRLEILQRYTIDPADYAEDVMQVVHGDFYPGNLLFTTDAQIAALLDWDFAAVRCRGIEVGRAAVEVALTPDDELDRARFEAFLASYTASIPLSEGRRRSMFRQWFNYLLYSLYPLPLHYQSRSPLPRGWEELAQRRHRMLLVLDRYLEKLASWAA